jgi:hypothetical protein
VVSHRVAGPAAVAVGVQAVEVQGQRVARLSAFDVERPGLWVAGRCDLDLVLVEAVRVDGGGDHRVAVRDAQDRLVPADRRVVLLRFEMTNCHL